VVAVVAELATGVLAVVMDLTLGTRVPSSAAVAVPYMGQTRSRVDRAACRARRRGPGGCAAE
jgi:hypothetical protein